ncbi:MAG: IPT/TIG domain-containing protein [Nitrososphaerales archaeon]
MSILFTGLAIGFERASAAPSITISPASGPPGTNITVIGTGFGPNSLVSIIFDSNRFLGEQQSDNNGAFTTTVTIPSDVSAGTHTVIANQGGLTSNTVQFTVTAPQVQITLTPNSGPPGTVVTVVGSNFGASKTITIKFDNNPITTIPSAVMTTSTGTFSSTITVPSNTPSGAHTVTATDNSSPARSASATFTVGTTTSGLTISPTSGAPGTVVTVSGNNFAANTSITINFDNNPLTTVVSSGTGSFSRTITIPSNAIQGSHIISATDGTKTESAIFTVTTAASGITLSPSSGPIGTVVTVSGNNFAVNTSITIRFDNNPITTSPSSIVSSNTGSFSTTITIPNNAAVGSHIISATDGTKTESATFAVAATSITLSPTSGIAGSTVSVSGTGFTAGASITIKFGSITLVTTPSSVVASSSGTFTATIVIPSTATTGNQVITASDTAGKTSTATFNVLVSGTIILSPTAGNRGTSVTVTGSNFNPSSTITISFDHTALTTNPSTVTTSVTGTFTATITIPITASTGARTITATDSEGRSGAAIFTVAAAGVITLSPNNGISGTEVTVTGSNFTANTRVTIKFNTITVITFPSTIMTSSTGSFIAKFDVPAGTSAGSHTVIATDDLGKVGTGTFTIQGSGESVTLSPASGLVGTTVTVTGTNFVANTPVTIKLDGNAIATNPASVTTTSTGTFTATITIPSIAVGSHTVSVTVGTKTASATFTLTQSQGPSIVISPTTGTVGSAITVSGSGFLPNIGVTVKLDGNIVATATSSQLGTFNALFTVLNTIASGTHTVSATDGTNNASATLSITGGAGGAQVISVSRVGLVDQTGVAVSRPAVGTQVLIQSDLRNNLLADQPFTYIVQIKDSRGSTIMISWMIGTLPAGKQYAVAQSWLAQNSGEYTAEVFVWQSISNPVILAPMQKTSFRVQ